MLKLPFNRYRLTLNRWQLEPVLKRLYAGGSKAFYKIMPGVSSLYYQDKRPPDAEAAFQQVPADIKKAIKIFNHFGVSKNAMPLAQIDKIEKGIDTELKPYKGDVVWKNIQLPDLDGNKHTLAQYKGKVVLLNFWATWCPPCVEEIPSMNRLIQKINDDKFAMVSINYGEEKHVITNFIKQFKVDFPILLDSDGIISKQWKVYAFPSTFVLNKNGDIVYGVNAAILWDSDEVISKIRELLKQ